MADKAGVKDAGGAGAVTARLALGRREQASRFRDRPDRPGTQGAVIFSEPGRRMVRWGRREAAGSPLPRGSRASGIRHWGGT